MRPLKIILPITALVLLLSGTFSIKQATHSSEQKTEPRNPCDPTLNLADPVVSSTPGSTPGMKEAADGSAQNILARWAPVYKKPFRQRADAGKPIVMKGPEGTILKFPAKAFVHKDGSPVAGGVEIALEEYYELTDFLRAGLHTVSDQGLLESGGTVRVTATAEGEEVDLAPGADFDLSFLVDKMEEGMKAWFLEEADTARWVDAGDETTTTLTWNELIYVSIFRTGTLDDAYFFNGGEGMEDYTNLNQLYPEDAAAKGITGFAEYDYTVTKEGYVKDVHVLGYNFPSFSYEGVRLLRTMRFAPAISAGGEGMESRNHIRFEFPAKGHDLSKYSPAFREEFQKDYAAFTRSPFRSRERWRGIIDRVEEQYTRYEEMKNRWGRTRRINIRANRIGLINCDAIWGNERRITQVVKIAPGQSGNVRSFLIFRDFQGIIPDDTFWYVKSPGELQFHGAPLGRKALLICVKMEDEGEYLASSRMITIGDQVSTPDKFVPLDQLRGIAGKIFNPGKVI